MVEDNQIVPLAPANINPRSDEEFAAIKPKISRQERSSKCLVYFLAGIVILSAIVLVFALIVFRPENPDVELSSVQVKNLNYVISGNNNNNASFSSFNMTLESELKMENSNFGEYKFDNTSAAVLYGASAVGETAILEGRVGSRDTKRMSIMMDVSSHQFLNNTNLTSDLNSGILKLTSYAKFSGKVDLLGMVKKKKTAAMDCSFSVNLRSRLVEDLVCN